LPPRSEHSYGKRNFQLMRDSHEIGEKSSKTVHSSSLISGPYTGADHKSLAVRLPTLILSMSWKTTEHSADYRMVSTNYFYTGSLHPLSERLRI
jgi:hypothetical protein